jgi:hypothetical protein
MGFQDLSFIITNAETRSTDEAIHMLRVTTCSHSLT